MLARLSQALARARAFPLAALAALPLEKPTPLRVKSSANLCALLLKVRLFVGLVACVEGQPDLLGIRQPLFQTSQAHDNTIMGFRQSKRQTLLSVCATQMDGSQEAAEGCRETVQDVQRANL
jgi:hypothetical protein